MNLENGMIMDLTVGPVQYHWPRETLLRFYADLADQPVQQVVLGEVVCSRRRDLKTADWLALGRELRQAGKRVWMGTLALIETEAELRAVRYWAEQDDLGLEANDAAAVYLAWKSGRPWRIGLHVNVYSVDALREYRAMGAVAWLPPVELDLDTIAHVLRLGPEGLEGEVCAFGRLPLALSARCFTARHHGVQKDHCGFICQNDPDGLTMLSQEGEPFLAINGIQTQSAAVQSWLGDLPAIREAGVSSLRLSPCSRDFFEVIGWHQRALAGECSAEDAVQGLRALALPGVLANGYLRHRTPGMQWSLYA